MSKYNESSTNWKLDSWHSIVLQLFILALIGGLSIFIYAKFFGPETTVTGPKGPKITALQTKNRQFSKEIADLKDQIEKAEKVVTKVLGPGEEGDQLTLLQARESFDSMFALVGSINDEDQNATFTDAQAAYDNLNRALQELKKSKLGTLVQTIRSKGWAVTAQEKEVTKIKNQIESREKDIAKYNYWKDLAESDDPKTKAATKKHAEQQAKEMYKVTVYAESILEELNAELEESKTKLEGLKENVKEAQAEKEMLDEKIAGYDDKLEEFTERMKAWKDLVKINNEEKKVRIENGKKLVELQGMLSGTNMIAVVEKYTEKRLKDSIKEKEDFIDFAETEIKKITKAITMSEDSLENLIQTYRNIGIFIPDNPGSSLPPLPEGSGSSLPSLPGVDPVPPATDNGPIDPATRLLNPAPTGLGALPVIPADGTTGVKIDGVSVQAKKAVERIRTEIKERRSEVEQLKKDKLEAEVSLEELKEDYTRFKQAKEERTTESTDGKRKMAELEEAKTQLEKYKDKINEPNWADAVAEYHKDNEEKLLETLRSRKERQTGEHTTALREIQFNKGLLKTAIEDVNLAEKKLIRALKTRKDEGLVEDLEEDLTKKEEDVELIGEKLAHQEKARDAASEVIKKLGAQITRSEARLNGFIADTDDEAAKDEAKSKKAEKLGNIQDMLYGEDWEQESIDYIKGYVEDKTKQFKERKDKSKSAVDDANKMVRDLRKKATTLKGQLAIWNGILEDADGVTKKTAENQVRKNTLKINNNDLALSDAMVNVETSEADYHIELKNYQNRLDDVGEILADLDDREVALKERRKNLNLAGANSKLARMFFDVASDREVKNYLSDLTKKITELEAAESKFSREVDSLKNSMGERKGELKLKKEELEIVTEKFDADPDTYLPGETIKSVGEQLKNLGKEVRTISSQIKDNEDKLAKAERNYNDARSQSAILKQAMVLVINRDKPKKPKTTPPDLALKQLEVAFKPYFTDPKGNDQGYDEAVHLVIKKPEDKTKAEELLKTKKKDVEQSVEEFNAFRELREGKSEQAKKNYTTLMDGIWDKMREGLSTTLDEKGQFHYINNDFTPTKDGETLFVFCIGRKDDKVRFAVEEITFNKSPKEPRRIRLSSVN